MTHDELLAKIDNEGEFLVQHFDSRPVFISALRTVVELHKPRGDVCETCFYRYPCATIQAIENELK